MPTHTVVVQSYRTHNAARWIGRCMETARRWARVRGFEYQFLDDRFFDLVPAQFRARTSDKVILSDLARLLVARKLLDAGHERVVWIDADVVVFDPDSWILPTQSSFYFSHELWPTPEADHVRLDIRANNAVMVFSRGNPFLDFYIDSCHRILSADEPLKSWHLGVRFLTGIRNVSPLPLLLNIGTFGAALLLDIHSGQKLLLQAYMKAMALPLVAANCCGSVGAPMLGAQAVGEDVFESVVEQCIASKGNVVNRFLSPMNHVVK